MKVADFSTQDVQNLRKAAGVGMMDAKKALVETNGDVDTAFRFLQERGLAKVAKRAGREATEGTIGSYLHVQSERPVSGVMVLLASETDFVAKSAEFNEAAKDIAMHVAWAKPRWIRREDVPGDVLEDQKDLISKQAANEGKPEQIIPKIVEGKIASFFKQNVLLDQEFVNSQRFEGTVGDMVIKLAAKMGENITVKEFSRLTIGEG